MMSCVGPEAEQDRKMYWIRLLPARKLVLLSVCTDLLLAAPGWFPFLPSIRDRNSLQCQKSNLSVLNHGGRREFRDIQNL
jgi:hypothetical protein